LNLTDGNGFFASSGGDGFVRLPFCALTPEEITAGIDRLAEIVRQIV
jgi:2-aminoadipate transaminase